MKILLTGGAGYIGSAAAAILLDSGHRITVYDSLVTGHRAAVPGGAEFVRADLEDRAALAAALGAGGFDAVMHFAGSIEAGESMRDPGKYFRNNVANSIALIEACARAGVSRFVFSSSATVYASSDEPLTEGAELGPTNVYGQTKLIVEQVLEWYRRAHGLRYVALRYFNAAGAIPGRGEAHTPESHLIPLVLQVPLGQRENIHIFGADYATPDGTCIRDYVHIADLVEAHLLALDALDRQDRLIYNVGNGAGYSVREVIRVAREVTGDPIPAVESPRRPGDAPRLVASAEGIRRELGWRPAKPGLREIVATAWEWHRDHPHGYG